jgi:hypothetical protein
MADGLRAFLRTLPDGVEAVTVTVTLLQAWADELADPLSGERLLSVEQAAFAASCSPATMRRLMPTIGGRKRGKAWRITETALLAYLHRAQEPAKLRAVR